MRRWAFFRLTFAPSRHQPFQRAPSANINLHDSDGRNRHHSSHALPFPLQTQTSKISQTTYTTSTIGQVLLAEHPDNAPRRCISNGTRHQCRKSKANHHGVPLHPPTPLGLVRTALFNVYSQTSIGIDRHSYFSFPYYGQKPFYTHS